MTARPNPTVAWLTVHLAEDLIPGGTTVVVIDNGTEVPVPNADPAIKILLPLPSIQRVTCGVAAEEPESVECVFYDTELEVWSDRGCNQTGTSRLPSWQWRSGSV